MVAGFANLSIHTGSWPQHWELIEPPHEPKTRRRLGRELETTYPQCSKLLHRWSSIAQEEKTKDQHLAVHDTAHMSMNCPTKQIKDSLKPMSEAFAMPPLCVCF